MQDREQECMYRTANCPDVLIVPAVVHGTKKNLPAEWLSAQSPFLNDYTNPRMERQSPDAAALSDLIKGWAPAIAEAMEAAPRCNEAWRAPAVAEMKRTYEIAPLRQTTVPRMLAA